MLLIWFELNEKEAEFQIGDTRLVILPAQGNFFFIIQKNPLHPYHAKTWIKVEMHIFVGTNKYFAETVSTVFVGAESLALGHGCLFLLATFLRISSASSILPFKRNQRTDSGIKLIENFAFLTNFFKALSQERGFT